VGNKTALKKHRTETGIKDTTQEHFLEKLFASYKGKSGTRKKQDALDAAVGQLPPDITSAVWRIDGTFVCLQSVLSWMRIKSIGLDPHQDTPVEVLHVVLLGFIKYFWRDLIQNRLKGNEDQKALLAQRLSSLDVSGLGISPLAGETLVNYAGSLTGRDFRHISQAAPFVIYDLVSEDIYDAWVSLSKLVPLIWQPVIMDIDQYIVRLSFHLF